MSSSWSPTLVVSAVITYKGKVLIHRRAVGDDQGGRWEFPGGKVHYGEDLVEAVRREITEELGNDMDVNVLRLLHCQVNDYEDGITEYCVLFYHCTFCVPPTELSYCPSAGIALVGHDELGKYDMLPGAKEAASRLQWETVVRCQEFSFLANSANKRTPGQTLRVLTYEVGKMNELFHKAEVYSAERNAHLGDMKSETSDANSMLRMWCEHNGWSRDEIDKLGEQRYLERMEDIRKHSLREVVRKRTEKSD